jgi:hypothetical protein
MSYSGPLSLPPAGKTVSPIVCSVIPLSLAG